MPEKFMGMVPRAPSPEEVNIRKIENLKHEFGSVIRENLELDNHIADVTGIQGDTLILGGSRNSQERVAGDLAKMYENLTKDSRFKDLRLTRNGISGMLVEPIGGVSKISLSLHDIKPSV